jgi:putative membrane protein
MRIWNEVTSIILVSIVFLVVLKNNVNWLKFTIGTILFVLVILILIKLYKRIRN